MVHFERHWALRCNSDLIPNEALPGASRLLERAAEAMGYNADKRKELNLKTGLWLKQHDPRHQLILRRLNNTRHLEEKAKAHLDGIVPPAKLPSRMQGVYVVGAFGHPVKIGIAVNIDTRLSELQTGSPYTLRVHLFLELPNGKARHVERQCHSALNRFHVRGEWFDGPLDEILELVKSEAAKV